MDETSTLLTDGGSNGDEDEGDEGAERKEDLSADGVVSDDEGTEVLLLDLRGLNLNLLGLDVSLSELVLDVSAVEGDGNILGNLLSAVTGLFDQGLGGLFGGEGMDFDFDVGERVSSAFERVKESVGGSLADIPLGELLTQVLIGVVSQVLGLDDLLDDDESDDDGDSDSSDDGEEDEGDEESEE